MEIVIPVTTLRNKIAYLIKNLRRNPETVYKITNRNKVVAELRAPGMIDKRGLAASRILEYMKTLPEVEATENVSENINDYLYGSPPMQAIGQEGSKE